MSIINKTKNQLLSDELESNWRQTIEGMIQDSDIQEKLFEWVSDIRDEFIDFIDTVDDPVEIKEALVNRYIEWKCRWMMLNTKMQYQAVETGQPDQELMLKGSLISQLLERIENVLGGDQVAYLEDFLADPTQSIEADKVESGKLEEFMDFIGELIVTGEMYTHLENSLSDEAVTKEFANNLQRTNQAFQELSSNIRESLLDIREIPIENHLQRYPVMARRMIEDADQSLDVELNGTETEIDKKLLEVIQVPLSRIVTFFTNLLKDDIFQCDTDSKPKLVITADRSGQDINLTVDVDDFGLVYSDLQEMTLQQFTDISQSQISERMVFKFIFSNPFTNDTSDDPTDVFAELEKIKGTVEFERSDAPGISINMTIPRTQSVRVKKGLLVEAGPQQFIISLDTVIESVGLNTADVTTVEDRKDAINLRGTIYPLHDLSDLLETGDSKPIDESIAMILNAGGNEYALKVDDILGQKKVVIRELGPVFNNVEYTQGSAVLGDGSISLFLDIEKLPDLTNVH